MNSELADIEGLLCARSLQSCLTLCHPMDCSPPDCSVHEILQARVLERGAMPSSRGLSDPGMEPMALMSPALAAGFFTTRATWEIPGLLCYTTLSKGLKHLKILLSLAVLEPLPQGY